MSKVGLVLTGMFLSSFAQAATFYSALIEACMNQTCDLQCQRDNVLYAAAKGACQQSTQEVKIECPRRFTLTSSIVGIRSLVGEDVAENPIDCSLTGSTLAVNSYSCESHQGSPYADLELSVAKPPKGKSPVFPVVVSLQDTTSEESSLRQKLKCTATLDMNVN